VYTARIDLAPIKYVAISCSSAIFMIILAVIIGQTGPNMENFSSLDSYQCPNQSVIAPCGIGREVGKEWSQRIEIVTRPLNKRWYCIVTPYPNYNASAILDYQVKVYVNLTGHTPEDKSGKTITNSTEISYLPCYDLTYPCYSFLLVYEANIQYETYLLSVRFSQINGDDLTDLGDVVFTIGIDNPEFSTMALVLKLIFLILNIVVIGFHYFRLRGKKVYWQSWTDEQRLFVIVLIFLVGLNNPFFPLEFLSGGWFVPFLGAFLELIFTGILFAFWYIIIEKFRSDEGKITLSIFLKAGIVLLLLYIIVGSTYFGITSMREFNNPIYKVVYDVTLDNVFYILTTLFYVLNVVLIFALTLAIILRPSASGRLLLKVRFAFFVIPTYFLVIAVLSGLLYGILGPSGRDTPSFVFYLFLYNIYVYLQLWGFWPIEVTLPGNVENESEGTKLFIQATQPTYSIDDNKEEVIIK